MRKLLTIGELAKSFDISTSQIRFYEKKGLLTPKIIDENGYRLYDFRQLDILESILLFRDIDIPIKEIEKVVNNYDIKDYLDILMKAENKLEEEMRLIRLKKKEIKEKINHVKKYIDIKEEIKIVNMDRKILKIVLDTDPDDFSIKEMYDEIRKYGYSSFSDVNDMYGVIDENGNTIFAIEYDEKNKSLYDLEEIILHEGPYISTIMHMSDYNLMEEKIEHIKKVIKESGISSHGPIVVREDLSSYSLNSEGSYFEVLQKIK
jgi:DNA-binding transcriptional MerR regulator